MLGGGGEEKQRKRNHDSRLSSDVSTLASNRLVEPSDGPANSIQVVLVVLPIAIPDGFPAHYTRCPFLLFLILFRL